MKEYYLEQIRLLERQIALAKVGYIQSVNHLADNLKTANEEECGKIIKELVADEKAYTSMKESLKYNQEEYRKEVEKEGKING